MGVLNRCRAYTIGSMDCVDGQDWRNKVKAALMPRGITIFDPYHKPFMNEVPEDTESRAAMYQQMEEGNFEPVIERVTQVRTDDLRLCALSDFLIVHITPRIAAWGSAEELYTSLQMNKPIFICIEGGIKKVPLWLLGSVPLKYFYSSIEEVIKTVERIDDGVQPIDNFRWKLLKPEYR